jgi:putative DNA primase/helicase
MLSAAIIARVMGGRVYQGAALVPGPNHSAADRSLRVFPDPDADGGFRVHSFAGDDPIECRDHVRRKMALPAWQPTSNQDTNGLAKLNGNETVHLSGPSPAFEGSPLAPTQDGMLPIRTRRDSDNKPRFVAWGDDGPFRSTDELRRHVYRRDGFPVRMKIKRADGTFVQWYRVRDGNVIGWQAKRPDGYRDVPYIGAVDPFDPELAGDTIFWPEGEKDCDTLGNINMPAFTFGGVGDGLPDNAPEYLASRHIVILADNDQPGREHAEKKAALASQAGAASINVVQFSELPLHADVSDFLSAGRTAAELADLIEATPNWHPNRMVELIEPPENTSWPALVALRASEIEIVPVEWLWPGKMALGKLSLIAGEPGLGKSQLTAALAAAVTTSDQWPCTQERAPLGSVVIFSAEDDPRDTIVPRLKGAGADLDRIRIISGVKEQSNRGVGIERSFSLQIDLPLLERELRGVGDVRLLIIDPITSYLGRVDSHKNAEIRSVLEPVAQMAARHGAAVIGITHFSKGGGTSAINRFIGSIGFIAAARAAFVVTTDPDSDDRARRLFIPVKNNLAPLGDGLSFRIEQCLLDNGVLACRIEWGSDTVTRTADEILQVTAAEADNPQSEAENLLRDILSSGEISIEDVEAEIRAAGLLGAGQRLGHNKTLRKARESLGVISRREGFGPGAKYYLRLPGSPCAPANSHARPASEAGAHGAHGNPANSQ